MNMNRCMTNSTIALKLSIAVAFDPNGTHPDDLRRNLHQIVIDAVNNGTLTGSTPATVAAWDVLIETMPKFNTLRYMDGQALLIREAIDGLKVFGGEAVADTVKKLQVLYLDLIGKKV